MIKMHIDLTNASAAELTAFYEIIGMKEAIGALNTRGRELNVALTMTGGEATVASLMSEIAAKLPPHVEYDESHKVGMPVGAVFAGSFYGSIYSAHQDGVEHLVIGPSGKATSMLDKMLPADQQAFHAWLEQQAPSKTGSIDGMRWPGLADAVQAKIQSKN